MTKRATIPRKTLPFARAVRLDISSSPQALQVLQALREIQLRGLKHKQSND